MLYPEKASPATTLGNPDVGWASPSREQGNGLGKKKSGKSLEKLIYFVSKFIKHYKT